MKYYFTIVGMITSLTIENGHGEYTFYEQCLVSTKNGIVYEDDCSCRKNNTCFSLKKSTPPIKLKSPYLKDLQQKVMTSVDLFSNGELEKSVKTAIDIKGHKKIDQLVKKYSQTPKHQSEMRKLKNVISKMITDHDKKVDIHDLNAFFQNQLKMNGQHLYQSEMARIEKERQKLPQRSAKRTLLTKTKKIKRHRREKIKERFGRQVMEKLRHKKYRIKSIHATSSSIWKILSARYVKRYKLFLNDTGGNDVKN